MVGLFFLILLAIGVIWFLGKDYKEQKRKDLLQKNGIQSEIKRMNEGNLSWQEVRWCVHIDRGGECEKCESAEDLHVHHKIPVRAGGDNSMNNLLLLCRSCHEKEHHVYEKSGFDRFKHSIDYFKYIMNPPSMPDDYGKREYDSKTMIIKKAISNNRDLKIEYRKPTDKCYVARRVTPEDIYADNSRMYLKAYCHLRKAGRVFRVSRMKSVEML